MVAREGESCDFVYGMKSMLKGRDKSKTEDVLTEQVEQIDE